MRLESSRRTLEKLSWTRRVNEGNESQSIMVREMEELVECLKRKGKKEIIMVPSELRCVHSSCIFPRRCYSKALQYVVQKREESVYHRIFRFAGTPGVGQTTFRYWVLRRWLLGKMKGLPEFRHLLFSVGTEKLYLLSKHDDGTVSVASPGPAGEVFSGIHSWSEDCLGVVELSQPGRGIHDMAETCPCVSLLMIVGSPGKFSRKVSCFKGRVSPTFYFPVWDEEEVSKLPIELFEGTNVDEAEKRRRYVEHGGVLRLMKFHPDTAQSQIEESMNFLYSDTIRQVVYGCVVEEADRLLKFNKDERVESFISKHVARLVVKNLNSHRMRSSRS